LYRQGAGGDKKIKMAELRKAEEELQMLCTMYSTLRASLDRPLRDGLPELPERNIGETSGLSIDGLLGASKSNVVLLECLETIRGRVQSLESVVLKFRKRRGENDPVTGNPRYGSKTMDRVNALLGSYENLTAALSRAFDEESTDVLSHGNTGASTPIIHHIRTKAEQEHAVEKARLRQEREAKNRLEAEELELTRKRIEEEQQRAAAEQHRIAEEEVEREHIIREAREAERRAQQANARRDREWTDSIAKGTDGVRLYLDQLVHSTIHDPQAKTRAVKALHTMFAQICAHPEEINFRRVRRDHPRFVTDIGQYEGGKELLIAAGFELGTIDDVPCYISKEPNIEKDMDGWSAWFDLLKATLEIVNERLIKL